MNLREDMICMVGERRSGSARTPTLARRAGLAVGLAIACLAGPAAQQTRLTDAHVRSAGLEVPRLVELLELSPGMTIADVGAGFGAWTSAFARWTGPSGHVFATEIGSSQLAALRSSSTQGGLRNVTVIEGGITSTNLPDACCDAILVRDAYHHFTEPEAMVRSLRASLKPGGRLAIIDFPPRAGSTRPEGVPADRQGHGVPIDVVVREVGAVLTHERTIEDWSPESEPPSLFLVIFRRQP